MANDDYRFSITADKYLEKNYVLAYIEDAVSQLLEHKEDNAKVNVTKFFSDYFNSVKDGNHVLFREYAFVRATPHNRASFVRTFWKCFRNIGRKGDLLSVREYHSLLCLLSPDFPFPPVQKTARIILMDDALDCLISFTDFLYAFQVQFCYDDFLSKCAELYKEMLQNPHDTVVVPTSEQTAAAVHQNTSDKGKSSPDGVDSTQFYRSLIPTCEKMDKDAPPRSVMKDILAGAQRVTFYGFLMALAKSEELNTFIGKLPRKSELLDLTDQELASKNPAKHDILGVFPKPPPLRPGSASGKVRPGSAHLSPISTTTANAEATNETNNNSNEISDKGNDLDQSTSKGVTGNQPGNPRAGIIRPRSKHAHTAARLAKHKASLPKLKNVADSTDSNSDSDTDGSDSTAN